MGKLALIFALFAIAWIVLAAGHGGWAWLYLWPGVSFLLIAAAYAGLGARVLGKRLDGTLAPGAVVLLLPYFLLIWLIWYVYGAIRGADAVTEVAPGLWVGRRVGARQLPLNTALVVDLTSEFWEPTQVRRGPEGQQYVCLPTLDHGVPRKSAFRALVDRVAASQGTVFVHCAQGFGRSVAFVAAVMIRRGLARDVDDAENQIKRVRPGVRLSSEQRRLVTQVTREGEDDKVTR